VSSGETPAGPAVAERPLAAVHVSRTFDAPPERVFAAWTDPAALREWFGSPLGGVKDVEADVRVGGSYRITARVHPTRRSAYIVGTFLEIEPPRRLVYTWSWERMPIAFGTGDSKVTVEFVERDGGTELRLTHELVDKRRVLGFHRWGWHGALDRLARYL
jgi:uncharacterized protein YndB with AHSA1/START domain